MGTSKGNRANNQQKVLTYVYNWIEDYCGISFKEERRKRVVEATLSKLAKKLKTSIEDLIEKLPYDETIQQQLISAITIGETYFFRNSPQFKALTERVLPDIIKRNRKTRTLKIWSAGCATGEEPYSIAIVIRKHFPQLLGWNLQIIATDINRSFIERAKQGVYREWSFRNVDDGIKQEFFRKENNQYKISDSIRKMVEFKYQNLAQTPYGAEFNGVDVLFCRNVMIYFSNKVIERVINEFHTVLRDGGFLFVGHAETFPQLSKFDAHYIPGAFYYQKTETHSSKSISAIFPAVSSNKRTQQRRLLSVPVIKPSIKPSTHTHTGTNEIIKSIVTAISNADFQKAEQVLSEAIKEHQTSAELHFLRAILCEHNDNLTCALEEAKKALFLNQKFVLAHYLAAILYERIGETKQAIRHYKNALNLLKNLDDELLLPPDEEIPAGRLREIVNARITEIENI